MTQLADTFDEEEREAVLEELDQLERLVRDAPGHGDQIMSIVSAADNTSTALTRSRTASP